MRLRGAGALHEVRHSPVASIDICLMRARAATFRDSRVKVTPCIPVVTVALSLSVLATSAHDARGAAGEGPVPTQCLKPFAQGVLAGQFLKGVELIAVDEHQAFTEAEWAGNDERPCSGKR